MQAIVLEQLLVYGMVFVLCLLIVLFYLKKKKRESERVLGKVAVAKEEGLFEPVSLHPYIDLNTCIGSAACVQDCPEKDILGIVNGKATVINTTNCVGHGACFHACPVEAISLRIGTEKRGVELPHVDQNFETNSKHIFIAGELGGMGLIKNSIQQGEQAIENMLKIKKPSRENVYDVVIVGAGPAGISASLAAKKHGMSAIALEQDSLGGTVNTFPRDKIVMTAPVDLPLHGKVKMHNTSKNELLELWQSVIEDHALQIKENTKVSEITPLQDGTFRVTTESGERFTGNFVLLSIGRRGSPRKLNVPGENSTKVAYRLLEPERISGKKIIVVGGGDSAVEAALLLKDTNEVTLSYRKDRFARVKPRNRELISEAMEARTVKVLMNSNLVSIEDHQVELRIDPEDDIRKIENDLVFIFAGGELPTEFLRKAGVEITKRFGHIVKKY